MKFVLAKKNPKNFLDSLSGFVVKDINLKLGTEMDQLKKTEFGCGYYFWYYYAEVCPPPGS